MTAYRHVSSLPVPSQSLLTAKEKRKQQLHAVWERRKIIYKNYYVKLRKKEIQE